MISQLKRQAIQVKPLHILIAILMTPFVLVGYLVAVLKILLINYTLASLKVGWDRAHEQWLAKEVKS